MMDSDVATEESAGEFSDIPPSVRPPEKNPMWPWVLVGLMLVVGIAIALLWRLTVPYYTLSPGPVYDTADFISVEDGNLSSDGELFFLTVSLKEANVFEWAAGYLNPKVDVRERERIRPTGVSPDQMRRESLAAMDQSKQTATFVALTQLGYEVTLIGTGALVIETVPDSAADGVLLPNDIIVEMDGKEVAFRDDIINDLTDSEIGDLVEMLIERPLDDLTDESTDIVEDINVELVLGPHVDDPTRPMIGVLLDNNEPIVEFPVEVVIDSQNIGGPSAGMMFTLQIMDQLTEGEITHGERIAGTGTISRDGTVGSIGGITQKVYGAIDAGAVAVLVPAGNYDAAVLAAGDDIEVVRVHTIDDAVDFLETL